MLNAHPIVWKPSVYWMLYSDNSGFTGDIGMKIANVLGLVRSVFEELFGEETVNSHPILSVLYSADGPIIYKRNHLIFLSSSGDNYLEHIYQFSHELCHFMIPPHLCYHYLWFEETLCQLMSWVAFQHIRDSVLDKRGQDYAELFKQFTERPHYIENTKRERDMNYTEPLSAYIRERIGELFNNRYNRAVNSAVALRLLPLFEQHPEFWQIAPLIAELNDTMAFPEAIAFLIHRANLADSGDPFFRLLCL